MRITVLSSPDEAKLRRLLPLLSMNSLEVMVVAGEVNSGEAKDCAAQVAVMLKAENVVMNENQQQTRSLNQANLSTPVDVS